MVLCLFHHDLKRTSAAQGVLALVERRALRAGCGALLRGRGGRPDAIKAKGITPDIIQEAAAATEGFSGRELAKLVASMQASLAPSLTSVASARTPFEGAGSPASAWWHLPASADVRRNVQLHCWAPAMPASDKIDLGERHLQQGVPRLEHRFTARVERIAVAEREHEQGAILTTFPATS